MKFHAPRNSAKEDFERVRPRAAAISKKLGAYMGPMPAGNTDSINRKAQCTHLKL